MSRLAAVMGRRLTATVEPSARRRFSRPPSRSAERICCQKNHYIANRIKYVFRLAFQLGTGVYNFIFGLRVQSFEEELVKVV